MKVAPPNTRLPSYDSSDPHGCYGSAIQVLCPICSTWMAYSLETNSGRCHGCDHHLTQEQIELISARAGLSAVVDPRR